MQAEQYNEVIQRKKIIEELAEKYKIVINEDDPVFAFIGFHQSLLVNHLNNLEQMSEEQLLNFNNNFDEYITRLTSLLSKQQQVIGTITKDLIVEFNKVYEQNQDKQKLELTQIVERYATFVSKKTFLFSACNFAMNVLILVVILIQYLI